MNSKQYKIGALLLLIVIFAWTSVTSATVCEKCGKKITDENWKVVGDKNYHNTHFRCYHCDKIIYGSFYEHESQYYHPDCYDSNILPKCGRCGKPVKGKYYTKDSVVYHTTCFENHIAKRCALCDKIIEGKYFIDFWGNDVHTFHRDKESVPECKYCGRFICEKITNGGVKYGDGRTVCNVCLATAITDPAQAKKIMAKIRATLSDLGMRINEKEIPLFLVDKVEMARLSKDMNSSHQGYTLYQETGHIGGLIRKHDFKIYLLDGLPRLDFDGTVAHELMHVWMFKNAPQDIDPAFCEGSSNYAAYMVLTRIGGDKAEYIISTMMEDPDPTYGEGFRQVKEFVGGNGIAQWLKYLKNNARAPWK
jgi:hypothetical protein